MKRPFRGLRDQNPDSSYDAVVVGLRAAPCRWRRRALTSSAWRARRAWAWPNVQSRSVSSRVW